MLKKKTINTLSKVWYLIVPVVNNDIVIVVIEIKEKRHGVKQIISAIIH